MSEQFAYQRLMILPPGSANDRVSLATECQAVDDYDVMHVAMTNGDIFRVEIAPSATTGDLTAEVYKAFSLADSHEVELLQAINADTLLVYTQAGMSRW